MDKGTYTNKLQEEVAVFKGQEQVHELPPIFHYYTNKFLKPVLEKRGYAHPRDFFTRNIAQRAKAVPSLRVVSYGAGNCDLEVRVAQDLAGLGHTDISFVCIELNEHMLARGRDLALEAGVADRFTFENSDVSTAVHKLGVFDVHMVHQALHHFVDLEEIFASIDEAMDESSIFLVQDVIGRNGHMRWPEALAVVERLWGCLLPKHRYNHQLRRTEPQFVNFDCSDVGFEGIRAQDIMPLMSERFVFDDVVSYGGIVDVFIDRSFGPNFDVSNPEDVAFVDYIQRVEQELLERGDIKPTQLFARLRKRAPGRTGLDVRPLVRLTDPPSLPQVSELGFQFANMQRFAHHEMTGDGDERWIGPGFHAWENESRTRWSARRFVVRLDAPRDAVGYECRVQLRATIPADDVDGGVNVFVNGVGVVRVEDVFGRLQRQPDKGVSFEFTTKGGPLELTFELDRPYRMPDEADARELGIVVLGVTAHMVHTEGVQLSSAPGAKAFPDGHFYSPVIDTHELQARKKELWSPRLELPGIDFNDASHQRVLEQWFPRHIRDFDYPQEPIGSEDAPGGFFLGNSQFSWLDARALYVFLRELRPKHMIEVGSGFSSLLTADVNHRFLSDELRFKCIEPYPRPFLTENIAGLSDLVVERVEALPLSTFDELGAGDFLFIDSSHVSKTGSDVNYLLLEVLPRLATGVLVHIHDIFLPNEYPPDWVLDEGRSWNEQYLVRALLMHSNGFEVVFGSNYANSRFETQVRHALDFTRGQPLGGGSLWLRRR